VRDAVLFFGELKEEGIAGAANDGKVWSSAHDDRRYILA
jgi:hypothetical protein